MINTSTLTTEDLVNSGIDAFRKRDFGQAIAFLIEAGDRDPQHWQSKLYLGMAYFATGNVFKAALQFRFIVQKCPDKLITEKAQKALDGIKPEQLQNASQAATQAMPKPKIPQAKPPRSAEDADAMSLEIQYLEPSLRRYT